MTPKYNLSQMVLEGRYKPGSTLLHSTNPSLKLVIALMFFLMVSLGGLNALAALMIVCLLAMALAQVSFKIIGRLVYAFRWLFLFIGLVPLFTTPGVPVEGLTFLPFAISWEGLMAGLESFLKLLEMFFISLALVRTTSPQDLMKTLHRAVILKNPKWKQAVQEFFVTGLWAVQLIPMICVETEAFVLSRLEEEKNMNISGLKKAWRAASQLGPLMAHLLGKIGEWEPGLAGNSKWDDWQPGSA